MSDRNPLVDELRSALADAQASQRDLLALVHERFAGQLCKLSEDDRREAFLAIRKKIKSPKLRAKVEDFERQVETGVMDPLDLSIPKPSQRPRKPLSARPTTCAPFDPPTAGDRAALADIQAIIEPLTRHSSLIVAEQTPAPTTKAYPSIITTWGLWDTPPEERPAWPAFCERLVRSGDVQMFGPDYQLFAGDESWELPRDYQLFLLRFQSLTVYRGDRVVLSVLDPQAVAFRSCELPAALADHRPFAWGSQPSEFGLDRAVVVEDLGHFEGWAFDTRTPMDGRLPLRPIFDVSQSEERPLMAEHWPRDPGERPSYHPTFTEWLKRRVDDVLCAERDA